MSEYNIKAARDSFIKTGAYLARDLVYLDEITELRVEHWRTGAMSLVRTGNQMFSECENRDARIAELTSELDLWKHRAERLYYKLDEEHYTDKDTDGWFDSDGKALGGG